MVICKLKELLESRDLKQLPFAKETGLSPATVGKLCRNEISRIDMHTLETIRAYFNLQSVSEIIEFAEQNN